MLRMSLSYLMTRNEVHVPLSLTLLSYICVHMCVCVWYSILWYIWYEEGEELIGSLFYHHSVQIWEEVCWEVVNEWLESHMKRRKILKVMMQYSLWTQYVVIYMWGIYMTIIYEVWKWLSRCSFSSHIRVCIPITNRIYNIYDKSGAYDGHSHSINTYIYTFIWRGMFSLEFCCHSYFVLYFHWLISSN